MAKKRRYKRAKASKMDITVVALIILSILLAVLIYTKSGVVGSKLNEILGGMMGIMQYILPIGIFAIAIKLASEGREVLTSKLIQYGIFIVSLAIMFSVFQISSGELQSNKELSEVVKDAYYIGSHESKGGGAIGAVRKCATYKTFRKCRSNNPLHRRCSSFTCIYIWNKCYR